MMSENELNELLESCLEWRQETGGTTEEAAARFPEHQAELLDLLETADQVGQVEIPNPRPEFRQAARTRMINLITAQESARSKPAVTQLPPLRQLRHNNRLTRRLSMTWIIVISILAAALAGGGGVAYASNDALPGDALYSVKTAMQDIELAFASDEKEVGLRLNQLDINLEELEELVEEDRLDDLEEGLEEYVENFQAFTRARNRVNYDDAGTEDSINQRLQTQYQILTDLEEQIEGDDELQNMFRHAYQLTETGKTYGPIEGGQPEEPGEPSGAGPAEPGSKPEDAGNGSGEGQGKPEDAGNGSGNGQGKPEDAGNGEGNQNDDQGRQVQLNAKGCEVTDDGQELCKPEDVGYFCTENDEGELVCEQVHPEYGYGAYLCEKMGDDEIVCKPEEPREGQFGPGTPPATDDDSNPGPGPGAKP